MKYRIAAILCFAFIASLLLPVGCSSDKTIEQWKTESASLNTKIQNTNSTVEAIIPRQQEIANAVANVQTQIANNVNANETQKAQMLASLAAYQNQATDLLGDVDKYKKIADDAAKQIGELNAKIQAASTKSEATGAIVDTVASIAAPFTGPFAPLLLIASNLVTGFLTRNRTKIATVKAIVNPIEGARDLSEEKKLGDKFLVVNKDLAEVGHSATNIVDMIQDATK